MMDVPAWYELVEDGKFHVVSSLVRTDDKMIVAMLCGHRRYPTCLNEDILRQKEGGYVNACGECLSVLNNLANEVQPLRTMGGRK